MLPDLKNRLSPGGTEVGLSSNNVLQSLSDLENRLSPDGTEVGLSSKNIHLQ